MRSQTRTMTTFTFVSLILTIPMTFAEHASIKSSYGHQLVTSSTLRWDHSSRAELSRSVPDSAVKRTSASILNKKIKDLDNNRDKENPEDLTCRAEYHGGVLLGQTTHAGYCALIFINKVQKVQRFELLDNVNLSAKLEWRSYAKFTAVPQGAVAVADSSDPLFIGRYLDPDTGRYLPGSISVQQSTFSFDTMRVADQRGDVIEVNRGEVMVEVEPVKYELKITDSSSNSGRDNDMVKKRPQIRREDIVLAKSSLFRFYEGRERESKLQKVMSYDYERSEYFGQIPGMIRTLPTTIQKDNGQVLSILWGLPHKIEQEETMMVGHALSHYSAVDVSIVAVKVTEEQGYSGILTSVFSDGARRERRISGVMQKKYLTNIRPEYSRVYTIRDSSNSISQNMDKDLDDVARTETTTRRTTSTTTSATYWKRQNQDWMYSDDKRADNMKRDKSMSSAVTAHHDSSSSVSCSSSVLSLVPAVISLIVVRQ